MTEPGAALEPDNWDEHWETYAETAELNPAQRYRRQIVCRLLERYGCSGGKRILDIGSGQGDLATDLRRAFPQAEIAGIELSAAGVRIAGKKVPSGRFFQGDLLQPSDQRHPLLGWAEYAICAEVLEHLDAPGLLLEHAAEFMAPGGTLVVTVPGGPRTQFDLHIGHRRHFTPAALRALLESRGFTVGLSTTAGFPFFNLYRLVVLLRGRRLIADVDARSQTGSSALARAVMALFRPLFACNVLGTRLGWQTIAVARWPGKRAA